MHEFLGLKPACSLILFDSTVYMYDTRVRMVYSSLESKRLSLA